MSSSKLRIYKLKEIENAHFHIYNNKLENYSTTWGSNSRKSICYFVVTYQDQKEKHHRSDDTQFCRLQIEQIN